MSGTAQNVTVYFATNRQVTNPMDAIGGYSNAMVPPLNPQAMTYGTAFIGGVDATTGAQGTVLQIASAQQGGFPPDALDDLQAPGRHLLIFIHGFDNTFSDAVTRAAYNATWLAACGIPTAETTVIAFSWPSIGKIFTVFPIPRVDYQPDQHMAELSGLHLMSFLANLEPIIKAARGTNPGMKVTLLAHSMGNLALQSAIENWFLSGNASDILFDQTIMAAADSPYDGFGRPNLARLSGLSRLSSRVHILYSHSDQVLQLSMTINIGVQRMGQDGPRNRSDTGQFPPDVYLMSDCTNFRYPGFDFLTSHQYYRQSPDVRSLIAKAL